MEEMRASLSWRTIALASHRVNNTPIGKRMKLYYIKKASKQDATRTVVVNNEAAKDFFGVTFRKKHDTASVRIKYKPGKGYQKVNFVKKQDIRLFIERNFKASDILLFSAKGDNRFDLETIKTTSKRYRVYEQILGREKPNFVISDRLPSQDFSKRDEDDAHEMDLVRKGSTEVAQLIKARRGQGVFRQRVGDIETRCRLTGVDAPEYLRASHIKPWRKSNDREKLDGNNGLMLAPHVDMLFDSGLISFENNGALLVSRKVEPQVLAAWGIRTNFNAGSFNRQQCIYLKHHRSEEFQR
jgi:hypothetical protein